MATVEKKTTADADAECIVEILAARYEHSAVSSSRPAKGRNSEQPLTKRAAEVVRRLGLRRPGTGPLRGLLSAASAVYLEAHARRVCKSDRIRTVPIEHSTRAAFRRQRAQQAADKLRAGSAYEDDPTHPLFTDELGRRLTPKAATNAFARLAKKAGLSTTSLHSTRHTVATDLIREGVDIQTVSSILGHSNASVTLSIYSHVVEGAQRAGIVALERSRQRTMGDGSEY